MLGRARTVLTVSKLHLITIFQRSTLEHIAASRGEQLVKGELPKAFISAVLNSSVHATPTFQRVLMYALAVTMTHPDIVSNQTNKKKQRDTAYFKTSIGSHLRLAGRTMNRLDWYVTTVLCVERRLVVWGVQPFTAITLLYRDGAGAPIRRRLEA